MPSNGSTSLLKLTNNAGVTLEGGLILAGLGKDAAVKVNGVWVDGSTFTMNGGEISGNTATAPVTATNGGYGGGVFVYQDGVFIMNGGTIYGYDSADSDNSNMIRNKEGNVILSGRGHAVCAIDWNTDPNSYYIKDTTVTGNVFYNDPATGEHSGWD
jgi:hypothetical protein